MTLGPALILLATLEHVRGSRFEFLRTFGRVPVFFYVVHLGLIHLLAGLLALAMGGRSDQRADGRCKSTIDPGVETTTWSHSNAAVFCSNDPAREYGEIIGAEAQRLSAMIEDMLMFAQMQFQRWRQLPLRSPPSRWCEMRSRRTSRP